ncbi:MAG: esterase-like activity of phytase family protein [Microcoleaceae cyanobacterium MO_207.B10]|nr:esterase-like activity of phytase family protein [Microcoleaceae cyanobacterium MO_207.B10]
MFSNFSTSWRDRLFSLLSVAVLSLIFLTSCGDSRIKPQERIFLDLSLDFLGEYQLTNNNFEDTPVGGISGIIYDVNGVSSDIPGFHFLAVSDDSGEYAAPRFYNFKLDLSAADSEVTSIKEISVEQQTFLKNEDGELFPKNAIFAKGIGLSPRKTVFIASAGKIDENILPFVGEFELKTGKLLRKLPLPKQYLSNETDSELLQGVQNGLGFDALTLDRTSFSPDGFDPFRLFTAVESPLLQDRDADQDVKLRMLHYTIADRGSFLVSENLYPLESVSETTIKNGLTELVALGKGGYFLSLERSVGESGYSDRIFQVFTGDATDTSRIASLSGELQKVQPMRKKLLLDFDNIRITAGNLEGMSLGPRLPDGSQSLLVVSDDNFNGEVGTRFLLFRLVSS